MLKRTTTTRRPGKRTPPYTGRRRRSSSSGERKVTALAHPFRRLDRRLIEGEADNVEPGRSMTWRDGMAPMFKGVRVFTLTPNADGSTEFSMKEEFSGLMLPMIKGSLPDFAPVFEAYAEDLKRAAESAPQT